MSPERIKGQVTKKYMKRSTESELRRTTKSTTVQLIYWQFNLTKKITFNNCIFGQMENPI